MDKIIVDNNTLFFAFKYALGRKSAAPNIVMTAIIKNIEKLDEVDIKRYINEIENCKDFGTEDNENNWLNLKKDLECELKFR